MKPLSFTILTDLDENLISYEPLSGLFVHSGAPETV